MTRCPFNVGDAVQDSSGICGVVVDKNRLGNSWMLKVRLPSGSTVIENCSDVGPCVDRGRKTRARAGKKRPARAAKKAPKVK